MLESGAWLRNAEHANAVRSSFFFADCFHSGIKLAQAG